MPFRSLAPCLFHALLTLSLLLLANPGFAVPLDPTWDEEPCKTCTNSCPQGKPQQPDCDYAAAVSLAEYPNQDGPRVRVDEAHFNNHKLGCTYTGFGDLLATDGYRVSASTSTLDQGVPANTDILVIAGAKPCNTSTCTATQALTQAEANQLDSWIRGGGVLVLIMDHDPYDQLGNLLTKLGLEIVDRDFPPREYTATTGLTDRLIFNQGVSSVYTIRGTTFRKTIPSPTGAIYIPTLTLDTASGLTCTDPTTCTTGSSLPEASTMPWLSQPWAPAGLIIPGDPEPINPEMQGVAIRLDQGRVYVSGEAAMFTAQCRKSDCGCFGMQPGEPGDNEQFLLNILHWLDN
jgi:hypothetical protein